MNMTELLEHIGEDRSIATDQAKAQALLETLLPSAYQPAILLLVAHVYQLRRELVAEKLARKQGAPLARAHSQEGFHRDPERAREVYKKRAAEPSKAPVFAGRHASPKILAASRAWSSWLETVVPIPGTYSRHALGDMNEDQLTIIAHSLYDASLQIHNVIEAMREAEVSCPRELGPLTGARALEAAEV